LAPLKEAVVISKGEMKASRRYVLAGKEERRDQASERRIND